MADQAGDGFAHGKESAGGRAGGDLKRDAGRVCFRRHAQTHSRDHGDKSGVLKIGDA